MRPFIPFLIFTFFLTGCSFSDFNLKQNQQKEGVDFKELTGKLISYPFCQKIIHNDTLYVTDFVNESNLENRSELGFLLANALKVNILKPSCTKNVSLKTFNLGKNLKVGHNGVKILTREFQNIQIHDIENDKQIVVGSYVITTHQIILFVKLINLQDGNTISSNTYASPITDEILDLEGILEIQNDNETKIRKPFHL